MAVVSLSPSQEEGHGRSLRPRSDAAPAGRQARTQASAGSSSTHHAESGAIVFLTRGLIANRVRRDVDHNLRVTTSFAQFCMVGVKWSPSNARTAAVTEPRASLASGNG